jgi:formylmethanofuran dehydrogenase subunit B
VPLETAAEIAGRLAKARYVAVVHDAEPGQEPGRDRYRVEGLLALAEALNGPTRAALSSLRAGGNRSGAEAALTWQTGYPMAVEFTSGAPKYVPSFRGVERLLGGSIQAALLAGSVLELSSQVLSALGRTPNVVIGPRASAAPFQPRVAIDTGVAGIHEGGTAYRMDEVPLPLRPPLSSQRSAAETMRALGAAIRARTEARL